MAEEAQGSGGGGGGAGVLSLSLYLLLLAFFILLVAISKFEVDKIDQVLFSLDETFEVDPDIMLANQSVTSRDGNVLQQESFFEVVDKLFRDELQFTKVKVVTEGDTMVIAVPEDGLFEKDSSDLRPDTAGLMGRLSESLKRKVDGGSYHLDMVTPLGVTEAQRQLAVLRAGQFARALIAHGAPAASISVGVRQRLRNEVHFFFALKEPGTDTVVPVAGSDEVEEEAVTR
jgi:flagellar motor protein MotB